MKRIAIAATALLLSVGGTMAQSAGDGPNGADRPWTWQKQPAQISPSYRGIANILPWPNSDSERAVAPYGTGPNDADRPWTWDLRPKDSVRPSPGIFDR